MSDRIFSAFGLTFENMFLMFSLTLSLLQLYSSASQNDAPVIGVLTVEVDSPQPHMTSYVPASYVKFLESAGARVVPVMINQTLEEYKKLFNSINGILYPGGHVSISSSSSSHYQRGARIFYNLAIEANSRGDYFPVWGTCLGFQELTYLTSGKQLCSDTDTHGVMLPLTFTNETKERRMFKTFPAELLEALASEPLTEHSHKYSITMESFNSNEELRKFYRVLSTNTDGNVDFVSTLEAYNFPIYGTQWHPEKNAFEWTMPFIPHSPSAIKTTFYMADFFVNEARKSFHQFDNEEEEKRALIYNYNPVPSGIKFEQIYFF